MKLKTCLQVFFLFIVGVSMVLGEQVKWNGKENKFIASHSFDNLDSNSTFDVTATPANNWVFVTDDPKPTAGIHWDIKTNKTNIAEANVTVDSPLSNPELFGTAMEGKIELVIKTDTEEGEEIETRREDWEMNANEFYIHSIAPKNFDEVEVVWGGEMDFKVQTWKEASKTRWKLKDSKIKYTGDTFSIKKEDFEGEKPKIPKPGKYTLQANGSNGMKDTMLVDIIPPKLTLVAIDASNPDKVKAKYKLEPDSVTLDGEFKVGDRVQKKKGLSGSFEFEFDQHILMSGKTPITLTMPMGIKSEESATGTRKQPAGKGVVKAYFLFEGGGIRLYSHNAGEYSNYDVTYSVPFSGKTTYIGKSLASLRTGDNPNDSVVWTENHQFSFEAKATGMDRDNGIEPSVQYRKRTHDEWVNQKKIKGTSTCASLYHKSEEQFAFPILSNVITNVIK